MKWKFNKPIQWGLVLGDSLTLLVVTIIGFLSYQSLLTAGTHARCTFVPWLVFLILIASLLGILIVIKTNDSRYLGRSAQAMVLTSPFAGFLRVIWTGQDMQTLFPIILGGLATLGIFIFRIPYIFSRREICG